MLYTRILVIVFVSLVLQVTLCPIFRLGAVCPNLVLIVVVLLGTNYGIRNGAWLGAVIGIFVDTLSGESIGPYLTTYLLCGVIAGILAKQVSRQHWLSILLITFMGTILEGLVIGLWTGHGEFFSLMKNILLPGMVYNVLVCIPVSQLVENFLKVNISGEFATHRLPR